MSRIPPRLKPTNRHLTIVPHFQEKKTESGVLLPEDYKPEQDRYIEATVVDVSDDCSKQFESLRYGTINERKVVVDASMIEEVKLPSLDFDGMKVVIPTDKFTRSFRAAKLGGDLVDLSVDASHFAVRSGEPTGESVETKFEAGELGELSVKQPSTSTYSIRFPNELARKINPGATESLEIKFKASYPLKVDWVSNGGGAKWTFLLAPRVTNE